jgi:hypothetical protein
MKKQFNYCIGYHVGAEHRPTLYTTTVYRGTKKDAKRTLNVVITKYPACDWKIFKLKAF